VVFNQDLGKLAAPRSATTRRCARYVLRRLMIDRTTVSAIAVELGVSWHTVNTIAMGATAALVAAAGPTGWPECGSLSSMSTAERHDATTPRNRRIRHGHHRPDTGA
jgi:hypothetical protein